MTTADFTGSPGLNVSMATSGCSQYESKGRPILPWLPGLRVAPRWSAESAAPLGEWKPQGLKQSFRKRKKIEATGWRMKTIELEESDVVRHLIEEDGKLLIAFRAHAAYYSVPLSNTALCAAIREAKASGRVVLFTHDSSCKISKIR
jgi:hypothetical protein